MQYQGVSRRTLLKDGVAALAGLTVLRVAGPAHGFPGHSGEGDAIAWDDAQPDPAYAMAHQGEEVIPWFDQPAPNPIPANVGNLLVWEALDSWLTPADNFFLSTTTANPAALTRLCGA